MEEINRGKEDNDVVLVGADTSRDLRKAYPNYFNDSRDFIKELEKYIDEKKKKFTSQEIS